MSAYIEEFAKKVIRKLRDDTITSCNVLKNPHSMAPLRLKLNSIPQEYIERVLDLVIKDIVDDTIFHLLRSVDGGDIKLIYISDEGIACDLEVDGARELAGWLKGDEGWIEKYSEYEP